MKKNRIIAMVAASVLGVSALPAGVSAADSYRETEKEWMSEAVTQYVDLCSEQLAQYKDSISAQVDMNVNLSTAGRAILGFVLPVNISWIRNIGISDHVSVQGEKQIQIVDIKVNDIHVCTLKYYVDMSTMDTYVCIPELSDAYLKIAAQEDDTMDEYTKEMMQYMTLIQECITNEEDLRDMGNLAIKYWKLAMDQVAEGKTAEGEYITAGGVGQTVSSVTGEVGEKEVRAIIKEVITEAKKDQKLKELIEKCTQNSEKLNYNVFLSKLDTVEKELEESETEEEGTDRINSTILKGEDGTFAGRKLSLIEGENGVQDILTVLTTSDGDERGLFLEVGDEYDNISLEGSGEVSGDLLSGNYTVSTGGNGLLAIAVEDYDTAAAEKGMWNGTYTMNVIPGESDGEIMDILSRLDLVAKIESGQLDGSITLSAESMGISLVTADMVSGPADALTYPDTDTLEKVYDATSEEEMTEYQSEMTMENILGSLQKAGMPDGFVQDMSEFMMKLLYGEYDVPEYGTEEYDTDEVAVDLYGEENDAA